VPERGDTAASLLALGFVGLRRAARQLRGDMGRPWVLLGLAAAVAVVAGLQMRALDGVGATQAPGSGLTDPVLRVAPLALPAVLLASTFSTPLRLQIAEASWVLTAPGGARALLARGLLIQPLAVAVVGIAGTSIARWSLGRPLHDVWKVALAGAVVGLALRLLALGGHVATVPAGAEFKRGAMALTYLRHPGRAAVTAAHGITHAALAALLAVPAAGVTCAVGLAAAHARGVSVDLDAADVARLIGATAFGASVFAATAVLLGALTRSSSAAITATVGWLMAGNLLDLAGLGVGVWFPFGLVTALGGLGGEPAGPVAVAVLLAWLAVLAVVVRQWALARDLT
jgi:hypothetical protein